MQETFSHYSHTHSRSKSMAPYEYEPLSSPATQIRLLELLPGRAAIECRLKITELEQAEYTYEPISYCWRAFTRENWWGCTYKEKKKQKSFRMLVDGADLYINESLHGALRQMRLSDEVRVLWADAICINQADDVEKAAQVAMMARIYQSGVRTLAWLGKADRRTRKAFVYLKDETHRDSDLFSLSSQHEHAEPELVPSGNPSHDSPDPHGWLRSLRASLRRKRLHASLESIINRPYFRRAWIVQEIAMSYCLSLMCGEFETEWRDLSDEFVGIMPQISGNTCFTALDKLRCGSYHYDLIEVATMVSPTQASDTRDKLYGILGLVSDELMTVNIEVDYTKDSETVFYDFTKRLLLASRNLKVLSMSYGLSPDKPPHVPSWVWNPQPREPHARFSIPSSRSCQYQAAGETQCQPEFWGRILGLRGIVLQKITSVSSGWNTLPRSNLPFHMEDPRLFRQQLLWYLEHRAIGGISETSTDPVTAEHRRGILFRTTWPYKFSSEIPLPACDQLEEARCITKLNGFDCEALKRFGRYVPEGENITTFWARLRLLVAIEMLFIRRALGDPGAKQFTKLIPSFSYLNNRRLARTDGGHIALCPKETEVSDKLVLLKGSDVPFILRPSGEHWQIVGECYVHALMDGSAWDESRCEMLWIE